LKETIGPKLEVDCGPLASFLRLSYGRQGLPGAHVLAVVPAHRGTYAEVRGRCWLQISSRNALQKQRSDESEREPRWFAVPGFSWGSGHRRSIATPYCGGQRPQSWRQGPGWRHERHSAARSLERGSGRVPRSVSGSEDPACQGRDHRKGPHEWKLLWVTEDGPLHGWDGRSSLGGYASLASSGHVEPCAGGEWVLGCLRREQQR
jgi:hypothetical protein